MSSRLESVLVTDWTLPRACQLIELLFLKCFIVMNQTYINV